MRSEIYHVAVNLFILLGSVLILFYMYRKLKPSKISSDKAIDIINTVTIGPKERLILVKVNNSFLLLGATPNHIDTLHVFNEASAETAPQSHSLEQPFEHYIGNKMVEDSI